MYSKSEVEKNTLEYFRGDELATNVWIDKYCLKNKKNELLELTPDDMHIRLAKELARIEQKYPNPLSEEEIYSLLKDFKYIIPGGSNLYGIGNDYANSSLANCFVIGNTADSYGGICNTDQEQVQLMKHRGGVGHDLSHIRPDKTHVSNAAGSSTGPLSFMERYSNSTREVAQDGRRGALMLSIDINHPDSEQFITSKSDLSKITGANISVKIDDKFMEAVKNDETYPLYFPTDYNVIHNPKEKSTHYMSIMNVKEGTIEGLKVKPIIIKAKYLWDKLIHQAWSTGEPGVLFWDKIKSESIPSCYGKEWEETSTNPCGEIPLCPYDSCRLMSVNLYSCVENPFTDKAYFNYDKFKDVVYKAQKLMDDIIDLEEEKINLILNKIENDPEDEEIKAIEKNLWIKIKDKLLKGRRTGLSAIGLADCFAALNITYGSDDSILLADDIYKQFAIAAYESSISMAEDRGSFPICDPYLDRNNPYLQKLLTSSGLGENYITFGRRNIALLTIPPNGTISLLAGISSSAEPVYQLSHKRRRKLEKDNPNITFVDQNGDGWEEYNVLHPKFKDWMNKTWDYNEIMGNHNSLENIIDAAKHSPYHNATAYEIDPLQRVKLQGTIQKWIDHSISSTINLPETATEEEVSNIYIQAWKEGCKGITVYRDNCRTGVLISNDQKENVKLNQHSAPKRPKILKGEAFHTKVKGELFTVIIGLLDDSPYEIFAYRGNGISGIGDIIKLKRGNYIFIQDDKEFEITNNLTDEQEAITRGYSYGLRHGGDVKFAAEQLNKTKGDLTSFTKAIARCLKKFIKDGEEISGITCSNCGSSNLIYVGGCSECKDCGNSKCG